MSETHTTNIGLVHEGPVEECEWCVPRLRKRGMSDDELYWDMRAQRDRRQADLNECNEARERWKSETYRLRASNKELLEALEGLVGVTRYSLLEPQPPHLAKARAAIAKARG
jgi:hypothetical protein